MDLFSNPHLAMYAMSNKQPLNKIAHTTTLGDNSAYLSYPACEEPTGVPLMFSDDDCDFPPVENHFDLVSSFHHATCPNPQPKSFNPMLPRLCAPPPPPLLDERDHQNLWQNAKIPKIGVQPTQNQECYEHRFFNGPHGRKGSHSSDDSVLELPTPTASHARVETAASQQNNTSAQQSALWQQQLHQHLRALSESHKSLKDICSQTAQQSNQMLYPMPIPNTNTGCSNNNGNTFDGSNKQLVNNRLARARLALSQMTQSVRNMSDEMACLSTKLEMRQMLGSSASAAAAAVATNDDHSHWNVTTTPQTVASPPPSHANRPLRVVMRSMSSIPSVWYAERPFPVFAVDLQQMQSAQNGASNATSNDTWTVATWATSWQVAVSVLDANGNDITGEALHVSPSCSLLPIRTITPTSSTPVSMSALPLSILVNGTANVSGFRFGKVSSRYPGGTFVLLVSVIPPSAGSLTNTSLPLPLPFFSPGLQVLSYRLFHAPKLSSQQLSPSDAVGKIKGIGQQYAKRLKAIGYGTVADLARLDFTTMDEDAVRDLLAEVRKDRGSLTRDKLARHVDEAKAIVSRWEQANGSNAGEVVEVDAEAWPKELPQQQPRSQQQQQQQQQKHQQPLPPPQQQKQPQPQQLPQQPQMRLAVQPQQQQQVQHQQMQQQQVQHQQVQQQQMQQQQMQQQLQQHMLCPADFSNIIQQRHMQQQQQQQQQQQYYPANVFGAESCSKKRVLQMENDNSAGMHYMFPSNCTASPPQAKRAKVSTMPAQQQTQYTADPLNPYPLATGSGFPVNVFSCDDDQVFTAGSDWLHAPTFGL